MYLKKIHLDNFRNYQHGELLCHPGLNFIVGLNAQGKTNLLEAIAYLSLAASFRDAADGELVFWQNDWFFLQGEVIKEDYTYDIKVSYKKGGKKTWKVNDQDKKKLAEVIGFFHTVIFSPEDLQLIKEGPAQRRRYLDRQLAQIYPESCRTLLQHKKLIKQKTALLKEAYYKNLTEKDITPWNIQLAQTSARIIKKRLDILQRLSVLAAARQEEISGGEKLALSYKSFLPQEELLSLSCQQIEERFFALLCQRFNEEKARGICLIGPQKDDMIIRLDGQKARTFASQGQQKSCSIALKLAELELAREEKGVTPVLLLDDVMSELDDRRKEALINLIDGEAQTFVTGTEKNEALKAGRLFLIRGGQIYQE